MRFFIFLLFISNISFSQDEFTLDQIKSYPFPNELTHAFDFNSNNESFEIYGLKNTIDVYVTLSFFCTADGEFHTEELKADFYEDKTTVLLIEKVIGCEPTVQILYE